MKSLWHRIVGSPIGTACGWWVSALQAIAPRGLRLLMSAGSRRVEMDWNPDGPWLVALDGQPSIEVDKEAIAAYLHAAAQASGASMQVWLYAPPSEVLLPMLSLPAAAERHLPRVLGYELDKYVPFVLDEIVFDYQVIERYAASKMLRIQVAVLRRSTLEAILRDAPVPATGLGLRTCRQTGSFNLLPHELRSSGHQAGTITTYALCALLVLQIFSALGLTLRNRELAVAALAKRHSALAAEADLVRRHLREIEAAMQSELKISNARNQRPGTLPLLSQLTTALDDHSWVERLELSGKTLKASIVSPSATSQLARIQQQPLLANADLNGAIRTDSAARIERFAIEVTLVPVSSSQTSPRRRGP